MNLPSMRVLQLAAILGAALAVIAPHLYLVLAGAAIAAIASSLRERRAERPVRVPLLPLVAVPALGFAAYYMSVIAAPTGLSLGALARGPFSPAAEAMLLPPLAIAAAGFFAPWPLARLLPGPVLSAVGVAILLRIGHGVLPGALDAWRTVFVPFGVVAIWGAVATSRVRHAAAAAAFTACFAAGYGGARAAWVLAAALVLAASAEWLAEHRTPAVSAASILRAAAAGLGAFGAASALAALLRTEVVYGVAAWAATLLLAFRLRVLARPE